MASEIRVNKINNNIGLGTISLNNTGQVLSGITTVENLSTIGDAAISLDRQPFLEMTQTISTDFSISSNYNAFTAGPVAIQTGVTVTIPNGSNWIVI